MSKNLGKRLEAYSLKFPQEVLMINLLIGTQEDQIIVYKGFSSSLINPTPPDPDLPVLSDEAEIISIDRLASPYDPEHPIYIQSGLTWQDMELLLTANNI